MINYSRGYASQLGDLVSSFLDSDGALTAHSDGINKAIKALQKQEDAMSQRLSTRETALRAQYTALDTQLSSMSSMSSYLTQQLAAIKANSGS
jgi:flagellar hook-associated protein 2